MLKIALNFDDTVLQILKLKSSQMKQFLPELVSDALKAKLEDLRSCDEHKGEDN